MQKSIKLLNAYAMSLGESVSSGPFFKAYIANLLPGQFVQPFIDAAFSDLGLDPQRAAALRSAPTRRSVSRAPRRCRCRIPRTGQGGEPQSDAARRDHRQARRSGVRSARLAAARPYWLLPLPRAAARAAARRPAAGAARRGAAGPGAHHVPTPVPVLRAGAR